MTTVNNSKFLNQDGDYYFCSLCNSWHRYRTEAISLGYKHIANLYENKTNSPTTKYFFCSLCGKWHTDARKDHLQTRLHIQRDKNLNPASSQPPTAPLSARSNNSSSPVLGPFDGTADLWMTEPENLSRIRSSAARDKCKRILEQIKGLDKKLHIQCFSKKNHFTFVVKGMKIAEIMPRSGDFVVTLIHNIKVPNSTKPDQVVEKLVFTVAGNMPVENDKLINHFISEAKNLIELRRNNAIGYREKWLHSLLIEKMENGGLPGSDLQFLYYEAPAGKIKRDAGFKRMHIDILAKERKSKALVIVEVKNDNEDLNAVLFESSDGKSLSKSLYVEWFMRYRDLIKPRIAQLEWDANIENLKFLIVAPDVDFKNSSLNMDIVENIKSLGCEVEALHLNNDWKETEDVYIVKTDKL